MSSANPYAPPTHDEPALPPDSVAGRPAEFRSSEGIATALRVALGVTALALVLDVGTTWLQIDLLGRMRDGGAWSMPEAEASDRSVLLTGSLHLLGLLVSAILWAVWFNRSNKNARALGADVLEFGPNAWGWFVAPVANLWKPYQSVRELWMCSDPRNSNTMTPPSVFGLWWATWITGNVLSQVSWRMLRADAEDIDVMITSSWVAIGSNLALVAAGVAAILIVTAVQRRVAGGLARATRRA